MALGGVIEKIQRREALAIGVACLGQKAPGLLDITADPGPGRVAGNSGVA